MRRLVPPPIPIRPRPNGADAIDFRLLHRTRMVVVVAAHHTDI